MAGYTEVIPTLAHRGNWIGWCSLVELKRRRIAAGSNLWSESPRKFVVGVAQLRRQYGSFAGIGIGRPTVASSRTIRTGSLPIPTRQHSLDHLRLVAQQTLEFFGRLYSEPIHQLACGLVDFASLDLFAERIQSEIASSLGKFRVGLHRLGGENIVLSRPLAIYARNIPAASWARLAGRLIRLALGTRVTTGRVTATLARWRTLPWLLSPGLLTAIAPARLALTRLLAASLLVAVALVPCL